MSVDFNKLLKKPAGEAKKPPALPGGNYPAILKSHELGDNNQNKTPYCRWQVGMMGWPEDVDQDDTVFDGKPIDVTKKQMRFDVYLAANGQESLWQLDEFLRGIGLDPTGRSYEEVLPETTGIQGTAVVVQQMNQNSGEFYSRIEKFYVEGA